MSQLVRNRIFDFERLTLFADGVEKGRRARMQISGREGYPRVTVFTGAPGKDGIISGPMDVETLYGYLDLLQKVATTDGEDKYKITLRNNVYVDGKRTEEVKVTSELWVGKDANGIVWTALTAEGFPKLRFEFKLSPYISYHRKDGSEFTAAEGSRINALSFVTVTRQIFTNYLMDISKEPRTERAGASTGGSVGSNMEYEDITL